MINENYPKPIKNTFCIFQEIDIEKLKEMTFSYISESGSQYAYSNEGVYRYANHWGRLANSKWRLEPLNPPSTSKMKLGFAPWSNLYPDHKNEKLYYIKACFETNTVNYYHKMCPDYDGQAILRTSFETTKKIKQIRNLFERTNWAKAFNHEDLEELRRKIIEQLIFTDKPLDVIKREIKENLPTW